MPVTLAFVLIHSTSSSTRELCDRVKELEGVTETYAMLDNYDLMAKLEPRGDIRVLDETIGAISRLDGILRVRTLISRDAEEIDDLGGTEIKVKDGPS